jgi:O-phospho-L-seryl-tRNASec:L-selenocysteinyl-tRNA synthase
METQMATLGSNNIVCVLSTTSCFAPRASDSLEQIAVLCSRYNIPHLVNNAYGLQSARLMHLIQEAAKYVIIIFWGFYMFSISITFITIVSSLVYY